MPTWPGHLASHPDRNLQHISLYRVWIVGPVLHFFSALETFFSALETFFSALEIFFSALET